MVKIHPHSNSPQLPPPPPPPPLLRRRTVSYCFLCQLVIYVCVASFTLLLVVYFATELGSRREVEIYVTDASLTNFNLKTITNDTFWMAYDMSLNITLTNPNKRISVYYDVVAVYAYYAAKPLAAVTLAPFYQGRKKTKTLFAVFEGNETLSFETHREFFTLFGEEKRTGVYSIMVVLSLSVRTKYCNIKYRQNPPYIYCYLRVPLSSMEAKSLDNTTFEATQCGTVHIIK